MLPDEHNELISLFIESVRESTRRKEVAEMGKTTAQVLIEEGERRGEKRGMIRAKQEDLLKLMQIKFSSVSPSVVNKIKATRDIDNLINKLIRKIITANSIDEMNLD